MPIVGYILDVYKSLQRPALKMMYLSVLNRPNMPSKWNSWNDELKRSQVNVAIMQQKNVIQPSLRLQNEDTSSMANSRPPTGAANAAETPAAAPAVVKLRLHKCRHYTIHPDIVRDLNWLDSPVNPVWTDAPRISWLLYTYDARKPSLKVAPTTLATLADRECLTGCYLFTVSNLSLLFTRGYVTGFPNFTFTFDSIGYEFWPMTLTSELDLDRVKMSHRITHLDQRSFPSTVNIHIHTHKHTLLP